MRLTFLKATLISVVVSLVTLGVIWGGVEKAYYVFAGDNIKAFLKISKWEDADLNLNVEAKGWQDQAVEGNITLKVIKEGLQLETYSLSGSGWKDQNDENSYDYQISSLKTGIISFPSVTTLPEVNKIQHAYIKACLRLKGDQGNSGTCAERAYSKTQLIKNLATNQDTLKSNSLSLTSAMAIAVVDYLPSQKTQKISFEIKLAAEQELAESFSLFPEFTGKVLDFSKVKISVFSKLNPAMPVIQINNGIIKQSLLFSMGQENLQMPKELKDNIKKIKFNMQLEGKTPEELVSLLKEKSLLDLAAKVDEQLVDDTLEQTTEWEYNLMSVMNAGFGDTKTNSLKWISGIWKPMDPGGYRIEVEVSPGAPEFRLYSLMTPFYQANPQQLMGLQWPGAFNVTDVLKKIEKEMTFNRPQNLNIGPKNLPGSLPESLDDLSPECRARMESFGTKLYTSLVFNGLAGGVVGKLVGGLGALFGATASGIESAGTAAGWISGGLFDALSPIDRAKFWISFAASSSVSMEPKTILTYLEETVTKGGDKNICLNKPFKLKANWYNECGMKMSGHNSHQFASLVIDRANSAGSRVVGPATGAKGLIGSGAEFAVVGILPGPAKLRVYVHDKEHYQDIDVNFVNCNSPQAKPR